MSDYIEREAVLAYPIRKDHYDREHGNKHFILGIESVIEFVENLPAADVAPVRHGRWIKPVPGDGENYCSVCHAEQPWFYGYGYYEPDCCPSCGARMDKEAAHES